MTDNMFDKFVRDKLADHQSPVPPGLWEKIERKKDKDPKGGFFLPRVAIWAGALIIAAGIGLGYYVSRNDDSQSTSTATETAKENTVAANNNGTNTAIDPSSATTGIQDDETSNSSNTNTGNSNNNNNPTGNSIVPGSTSVNGDLKRNNPDQNITNTGVNAKGRTSNHSGNTNGAAITPIQDDVVTGYTAGKTNNNNSIINSGRKKTGKQNSERKKKTGTLQPDLSSQQDDIMASIHTADQKYVPFTAGKTAYNLRSLAGFSRDNYNLSELKIISIDCPPRGGERRNDWYLEVYGSPDIVMKSVKSSNSNLTSKKDSTESQQLSYTAGFRISKSIGENLLIKTGLQYSQINERFDLRTENERRIITVVTIRTVIGSNGADSTVSDTSTVEQIGYRLQRSYNRYRSIDIPVLLSYEFGNDNLKFAVNAGAIINLYSWYKGTTINDSLTPVSMSSKNSGVYKQNIGIGLYAGFSIIKPISNKFDLFAEPYFRYNFSNMSRSAGYSQRFNAMGINLGIRYKLKGRQRSVLN